MTPLLGTFSAASARGFGRGLQQAASAPTPEYWWRADSGLSTTTWTAYAGGLDFTLTNVTSADSTNGVLFNGSSGYGLTGNAGSNIDAKHVLVRFNNFNKTLTSAILGATQDTRQTVPSHSPGPTYRWETSYYTSALTVVYSQRLNTNIGTSALWLDFTNNATNLDMYEDNSDTKYTAAAGVGTFVNYVRWESGFGIYLARRGAAGSPLYMGAYVKEIAIFTTALTVSQVKSFRTQMFNRWP